MNMENGNTVNWWKLTQTEQNDLNMTTSRVNLRKDGDTNTGNIPHYTRFI
jgi:hypothetical protein